MVAVLAILTTAGCQPADRSATDQTDVELIDAQGPFVCQPSSESGFSDLALNAFEDLGSGVVSRFSHFVARETAGSEWDVFDCATGKSASVQIRRSFAPEFDQATGQSTQRPGITQNMRFNDFYIATRSRESAGFGEIVSAARGAGLTVDVVDQEAEVCGCYAAYPEMRGSKTPFTEGSTSSIYEVIQ